MEKFPLNADTMNAITTGLGAIVFAVVRQLPSASKDAFANDLAAMARARESAGDTSGETLLLDLHRAALTAK